jgi:hypothetical protein
MSGATAFWSVRKMTRYACSMPHISLCLCTHQLYELWSNGELPYKGMTVQQVWVEVLAGHRMSAPQSCPPAYYTLMTMCWEADPHTRPTFDAIIQGLIELRKSRRATADALKPIDDDLDSHDYLDFTNGCVDAPHRISLTESSTRARSHRPTREGLPIFSRRQTMDRSLTGNRLSNPVLEQILSVDREDSTLDLEINHELSSSDEIAEIQPERIPFDTMRDGYINISASDDAGDEHDIALGRPVNARTRTLSKTDPLAVILDEIWA